MKKAYTFDDLALVPQYNNIASRTEPNLSTWLTRHTIVDIPIIPSNMDTVIGYSLADVMIGYGVKPIVHRFMNYDEKMKWIKKYGNNIYMSCGCKEKDLDELFRLYDDTFGNSFRGVCFDVAHGHSKIMIDAITRFKQRIPNQEIIAGNVCTAMAYHDLAVAGADAIKVGVGPGGACCTRMVTGFGVPQLTAIMDCAVIAEKLRVPLIADGGIRNSRDIVLALAAGASSVMVGKLFALTYQSAATKIIERNGKVINTENMMELYPEEILCKYRGQASEDFQTDFYGGLKDKTVAEGVSFYALSSGPTKNLIEELLGGLRSGMTYGGARNIKELQRKAEFVEVLPSYLNESKPRED